MYDDDVIERSHEAYRQEMVLQARDRKIGRAALIVACALAVFLAAYSIVSLIGSYA